MKASILLLIFGCLLKGLLIVRLVKLWIWEINAYCTNKIVRSRKKCLVSHWIQVWVLRLPKQDWRVDPKHMDPSSFSPSNSPALQFQIHQASSSKIYCNIFRFFIWTSREPRSHQKKLKYWNDQGGSWLCPVSEHGKWVRNNQSLAIVWIEFIRDLARLTGLTSNFPIH